jgi:hypothetical protein
MQEEKFKRSQVVLAVFEIVLKSIGFIIGILIGVYQFNKQQSQNKTIEYRKDVWQKELAHYEKICTSTGKILTSITPNQIDPALYKEGSKEFLIQYWGEALFYTDDSMKTKLMDFREQIGVIDINTFKDQVNPDFDQLESIRKAGNELIGSYEKRFSATRKKLTDE